MFTSLTWWVRKNYLQPLCSRVSAWALKTHETLRHHKRKAHPCDRRDSAVTRSWSPWFEWQVPALKWRVGIPKNLMYPVISCEVMMMRMETLGKVTPVIWRRHRIGEKQSMTMLQFPYMILSMFLFKFDKKKTFMMATTTIATKTTTITMTMMMIDRWRSGFPVIWVTGGDLSLRAQ